MIQQRPFLAKLSDELLQGAPVESDTDSVLQPSVLQANAVAVNGIVCVSFKLATGKVPAVIIDPPSAVFTK